MNVQYQSNNKYSNQGKQTVQKIKTLCVVASLLALSACSSNDSKLKEYMKCGMAASQLGDNRAAMEISNAMGQFIADKKVDGNARKAMFLGQEVRDDLGLHNKSLESKMFTFLKIYNSSFCQKQHNQGKANVPWKYYLVYLFV